MRYLKLLMLSAAVLAMTTACDPPWAPLKCQDYPWSNLCEQSYQYKFTQMRSEPGGRAERLFSIFDAADFSVDLSSSNIPVINTSGYATVVIDLSDGSKKSTSFEWIRLGDSLIIANPSAVNAWVQPKLADMDAIHVEFGFEVESAEGVNLVVTILNYQGTAINGSSDSWYVSDDGGCGGHCQTK